ncbi:MAG: ubiquinol-cytochrome C chaperone family protein [Alphaproteobacteria bacterium]|nr:ubiquinol-cytochrome C chaperone family protein [Alphaproteobacteria bacterium]
MGIPLHRRIADWLSGASAASEGRSLYEAALAQSRRPALYARHGVPDTLDGRFDCLALHVALLVRRLAREPAGERPLQDLYTAMFDDMDRTLREMGVGDLGIGKRVQAMGEALMGRVAAYGEGLDGGDAARLAAAVTRNLYGTVADPAPGHVAAIVAYLGAADGRLAAQPLPDLFARGPDYPTIEAET